MHSGKSRGVSYGFRPEKFRANRVEAEREALMARPSTKPIEEHYSVKQVAGKLSVSVRTVWRWIEDERLAPVYRLDTRTVRIPARAVNRFLSRSVRV